MSEFKERKKENPKKMSISLVFLLVNRNNE